MLPERIIYNEILYKIPDIHEKGSSYKITLFDGSTVIKELYDCGSRYVKGEADTVKSVRQI